MPTRWTNRHALFETLKAGIVAIVEYVENYTDDGDDPVDMGFDAQQVVAEPDFAPQADKDSLSMQILVMNEKMAGTPDTTNRAYVAWDVRSTIQLRSYGPQAMSWLDIFTQAIGDPDWIEWFRVRGMTVEDSGDGISDISESVGGRTQVRGLATLWVSCRSVRQHVSVDAETVRIDTELATDNGVGEYESQIIAEVEDT
jgi:hypothetical protein